MSASDEQPAPTPDPHTTEPDELTGVVTRIIYHSEESGYTVCTIRSRSRQEELTVVGNCPVLYIGETLKAEGRWTRHKQHGCQFQADRIFCYPPATAAGIKRYLASGMIKGIGEVMAERLVQRFGAETLNIIDRESRRLEEVEGIGPVRRETIKKSWNDQKAVRDIMIFLQDHGVGPGHAMRIHHQYGNDAIAVVRSNPYRLCQDVWGIGFKTADRIAMSIGIPPHSEIRARAGVLYLLETLADEGHCHCPREDLLPAAEQLLEIPDDILNAALAHDIGTGAIIEENHNLYLAGLHQAETGVARGLHRLMAAPPPFSPIQTDRAVAWAERRIGIRFAAEQTAALKMALASKVSIITGGPGVGKTTIVRALVDIFRARNLRVSLAAPTGRAAKRMEEATAHEAKTIHRFLKYDFRSGQFEHGHSYRVEGDVFILDEVSMVDILLMDACLAALPDSACLILVGDADQLPSVGPGNVLRDLIDSGRIPATKLTTIFRQEARSWIVQNAHRVNRGELLELPPDGAAADFFFIEAGTPDEAIQKMLELLTRRIPNRFAFDPQTEIQVLTPMRKNQLGSENLNTVLQEALNPAGAPLQRFGRKYKPGDRVMQIRNNYEKEVFNGDVGILDRIDPVEQKVTVDFDGSRVAYDFDELDELDLAYACSVHKSQGSEYPAVILLITTQHYRLLQRNLLYTAITRARKLVCLVGSSRAVRMAIQNNHVAGRRTGLLERLQALPAG